MTEQVTLVLVETEAGALLDVSAEALTFARSTGGDVQAVLFGEVSDAVLAEVGGFGATSVHVVRGDDFAAYAAAAFAGALVEVAAKQSAAVLLAAGTPRGSELLAHAAARSGVAMAANVVRLEPSDPLLVSRQVLGGTALEVMRLPDGLALLTVAGHAVEAQPVPEPRTPEVVEHHLTASPADLRARVVRTEEREQTDTGALTSARVVVGAGRGAGSAEGFGDLLELTELLGGALGVSRVVTSLGWRPHHEQVGQTGSRITPDVYIPCGISGAIQHWAGCDSAKTIVAVNTDAEAPMVTKAHYAVIGDLHEIVPAINEEIRRRRR